LIALAGGIRVELYHLERLTSLLNSPKGCGIRLEYLRIVMTEPEQWAFWSTMNVDVVRKLVDNEKLHDAQLQKLSDKIDSFMERTNALIENLRAGPSSLTRPVDRIEMPTSSLSASMLCWIHRVLTEGDGQSEAVRGRFRAVQTWIGPAGATTQTASFVPPPPEQIPGRISVFLDWWRAEYPDLIDADRDSIIAALAEFHQRFLAIHPFLDANGRVARCLLDQAARELLNQGIGQDFTADTEGYFGTLKSANKGDFSALEARIAASLQ
jgi:fido (protein-threonine AMPylation protein)